MEQELDEIQLVDLLESYPNQMTPGFQTLISAKQEFSELSSAIGEKLPEGRGALFKHQKLTQRFLRAYDDLIILSETGTGKSCEVLGFTEYTRKELEKSKLNPYLADEKTAHFKRVIVLVKGKTQKEEVRNQLTCKCSDGSYETPMVINSKNEASQKSNLTREVGKAGYEIRTYKTFAREIRKKYPNETDDQRLAEDYADTIFWVDEAHNLLIIESSGSKKSTEERKEKEVDYQTIWRVFHLAKRSKRIISTATPMINSESEIGSLMNLILPLNGQIPMGYDYINAPHNDIRVLFPTGFDYRNASSKDIRALFPGLNVNYKTATPDQMMNYFSRQMPRNYDYQNASPNDIRTFFPYLPTEIDYKTASFDQMQQFYRGNYQKIGEDYRLEAPYNGRVLFPDLPFDYQKARIEQIGPYFRGQFPPKYPFNTATIEDLEPFFRGRITYIRATNTGAVPEEKGTIYNGIYEYNGVTYQSQSVLYSSQMSDFQRIGYQKSHIDHSELRLEENDASNFVFPDGNWGIGLTKEEKRKRKEAKRSRANIKEAAKHPENIIPADIPTGGFLQIAPTTGTEDEELEEVDVEELGETDDQFEKRGFRKYVVVKGDTFTPTPEFQPWLKSIEYIRTLSCKYATICELVLQSPGNVFIYGESVYGSGDVVLALCLEGLGFTRYTESSSIFMGLGVDVKPLCAGSDREAQNRRIRPDFEKKPRYVLLTKETTPAKFHSMMETMNSYENRHGEYIKVFISAKVGREGININNVVQIHLTGGEWNQSNIYQALSRGIRATSHEDLINEERNRLKAIGEDPSTARINLEIYKHAAISIDPEAPDKNESVDVDMYLTAEGKDRAIKRIMRIMKQTSISCQIHYKRNVKPGDPSNINNSPTCDYDICEYQCYDPVPTNKDFSTYDVLYANEQIESAQIDIENAFRQRNVLTLQGLEQSLANRYRRKYLIMALERLIVNKVPLTDRFGYTAYLREDGMIFYLDRNHPSLAPPAYSMSYYTQGIIGVKQETLGNIALRFETLDNRELLHELEKLNPTDPEFDGKLDAISVEGQVTILEEAIVRSLEGKANPFTDAIIKKYQRFVFNIREPVTELNKVREVANQTLIKRGRKPNPLNKNNIKKINPNDVEEINQKIVRDEDTEPIYLHTLYSQVVNQTGYAQTSRYNKAAGRIRLLKPSELNEGWRNLNDIESSVYNRFIQIEIALRNKQYEDQGIYGFILGGDFKIRNRLTETDGAAKDARRINRGKNCTTWSKPGLVDVMWHIGVAEPGGHIPETSREEMIRYLREQNLEKELEKELKKSGEQITEWPLDRLRYYYKWMFADRKSAGVTRPILCELIKQKMMDTGLLVQ